MNVRILRLLALKQYASARQYLRSLRTPRRFLALLAMGALLGLGVWQGTHTEGGLARESLAVLGAMFFVMSIATGFVQQGPRFTPADVDFLFPAPFSPRHLLVWRLLHLWPLTLFTTLFFLVMFSARLERPVRFLTGIFLLQVTGLHLQLLIAVLMTKVGDALVKKVRGFARMLAMATLFGALIYLLYALTEQGGIRNLIAPVAQAPAARVLLFPVTACVDFVFGETAPATTFAFLRLLLGAIGTLGLLLLPDIDFREESVATTARVSRLLAARRRTGAAVDLEEGRRVKSGAVPAPRLLFRASGAIVWKNLMLLVRSWKQVLPGLLIGLMFVLPLVIATRRSAPDSKWAPLVPVLLASLFWSNALAFDLRRETDRLDQLRALPLAPSAIVLAELVLPWAVIVTLQEALVAGLSFTGSGDRQELGLIALVLPLLTFLALLVDNLALFLFAPRTQQGSARGTFSSSSPAQMVRPAAWLLLATPGIALGLWVGNLTQSVFWAAAAGTAVELALATILFFTLVRWFESREVEVGE